MAYEQLTEDELEQHLEVTGLRGLALDIDDTLSYTGTAWLEEVKATFGGHEVLTRDEFVEKYGWFDQVPGWPPDSVKTKVLELVDSNEFHDQIPLNAEALAAVREIHEFLPIVAYITARPSSVFLSSQKWLAHHGFPDAPILFRTGETSFQEKNMWKARVLKRLYPAIVGIVDDHPELPEQLKAIDYEGTIYLYDNGTNLHRYNDAERHRLWDEIASLLREKHSKK